jgi:uncharacterized protein (TIGR02300 family)
LPDHGQEVLRSEQESGDLAYTGEVVPIAPVAPLPPRWRGGAARATPVPTAEAAPESMETEELVSLEEADVEEDTGKVKPVVPEFDDDIDDETIEDDRDDEDSTIIADEEEGDEDVTEISVTSGATRRLELGCIYAMNTITPLRYGWHRSRAPFASSRCTPGVRRCSSA